MFEWICISLLGLCICCNIRDAVGLRDELNQVKRELVEIKKLAENSIYMCQRQNSFFTVTR